MHREGVGGTVDAGVGAGLFRRGEGEGQGACPAAHGAGGADVEGLPRVDPVVDAGLAAVPGALLGLGHLLAVGDLGLEGLVPKGPADGLRAVLILSEGVAVGMVDPHRAPGEVGDGEPQQHQAGRLGLPVDRPGHGVQGHPEIAVLGGGLGDLHPALPAVVLVQPFLGRGSQRERQAQSGGPRRSAVLQKRSAGNHHGILPPRCPMTGRSVPI